MAYWGKIDGSTAEIHSITDGDHMTAKVSNFGARLVELWQPDKDGMAADIVLGHDRPDQYDAKTRTYFGATCGRFGNRINGGSFHLGGKLVQLERNENGNHLHGGSIGFDRLIWQVAATSEHMCSYKLRSPNGDMGYPGTVDGEVTYAFTGPGILEISMTLTAVDQLTIGNLVHHSYFNLAGQGSGDILDHHLAIDADCYLPVDARLIPTGAITPVEGTCFDFRASRRIGEHLPVSGFDHNFCLNSGDGPKAILHDPASGRRMQISTNQPGLQFYCGTYLPAGLPGKSGAVYGPFSGLALETQIWPDSPNRSNFPNALIEKGAAMTHRMKLTFSADPLRD